MLLPRYRYKSGSETQLPDLMERVEIQNQEETERENGYANPEKYDKYYITKYSLPKALTAMKLREKHLKQAVIGDEFNNEVSNTGLRGSKISQEKKVINHIKSNSFIAKNHMSFQE